MQARIDLIACDECDAIHRKPRLSHGQIARCVRCDAELERHGGWRAQHLLPLALTSFIVFIIANSLPIAKLHLQGLSSQTTLIGAVMALNADGDWLFALLVLTTVFIFPLIQLCLLLYIACGMHLLPRLKSRPPFLNPMVRLIQALRPWSMLEVFMLGIVVAIIKLAALASLVLGAALWAYIALTILLSIVLSLNPRYFWQVPAYTSVHSR